MCVSSPFRLVASGHVNARTKPRATSTKPSWTRAKHQHHPTIYIAVSSEHREHEAAEKAEHIGLLLTCHRRATEEGERHPPSAARYYLHPHISVARELTLYIDTDARNALATPSSLSPPPLPRRDPIPLSITASTAPPILPVASSKHATSSDVPLTASQTSAHSGASKRVVSNGKQVVLNSDSDSDSLPELDFGELTTSFKTVAPVTRLKRTTECDEDGLRKPERRVKSKKLQFDHVVETAQKSRELERIISEHKANLENDLEEAPAAEFVLDEDVLGQAIHDDDNPDTAHRLFLAMQRTNATHVDSVFHFFDHSSTSPAVESDFPAKCLPKHRWTTSFRGKIKESFSKLKC
jgi:hypothetical protein